MDSYFYERKEVQYEQEREKADSKSRNYDKNVSHGAGTVDCACPVNGILFGPYDKEWNAG